MTPQYRRPQHLRKSRDELVGIVHNEAAAPINERGRCSEAAQHYGSRCVSGCLLEDRQQALHLPGAIEEERG